MYDTGSEPLVPTGTVFPDLSVNCADPDQLILADLQAKDNLL